MPQSSSSVFALVDGRAGACPSRAALRAAQTLESEGAQDGGGPLIAGLNLGLQP